MVFLFTTSKESQDYKECCCAIVPHFSDFPVIMCSRPDQSVPVACKGIIRVCNKEALQGEGGCNDETVVETAKGVPKDNQLSQLDIDRQALHDLTDKSQVTIVGVHQAMVHYCDSTNLQGEGV